VTRRGTARVEGYALLAALLLVGALAVRRPELAIAAAPFALVLAAGTTLTRNPRLRAALLPAASRTLEGDPVEAALTLESSTPVGRLEVFLELPAGVEVAEGDTAFAVSLAPGEEQEIPLALRCTRWGVFDVG
jgi:uncharacterized protein (DUF58 family)